MSDLQHILAQLVSFPSISPKDAGCQEYMMQFLKPLGFICQEFNKGPVSNFFASLGDSGPFLVFAGHTDVVPVGDVQQWESDPFLLTQKQGLLYGRGTADMKGSLASMLVMAKRFTQKHPSFPGRLGFLITSGEEGDDFHFGTPWVMQKLNEQGIKPNFCLVGEPSSQNSLGDVIKIGRRGSLSASIKVFGQQGHVAYPHLADNPIHALSPLLGELTRTQWDKGNEYFPPTSMQISAIHSGGDSRNIIPGTLDMKLNFRYSTEQTAQGLKEKVANLFETFKVQARIEWRLNGEPFLTNTGPLLQTCKEALFQHRGNYPELSTSGGTSDGRFIAPYGVEVIELGPVNKSIHQVNEHVALRDLEALEAVYFSISEALLTDSA